MIAGIFHIEHEYEETYFLLAEEYVMTFWDFAKEIMARDLSACEVSEQDFPETVAAMDILELDLPDQGYSLLRRLELQFGSIRYSIDAITGNDFDGMYQRAKDIAGAKETFMTNIGKVDAENVAAYLAAHKSTMISHRVKTYESV